MNNAIGIPEQTRQRLLVEKARMDQAENNINLIVTTLGLALNVPNDWSFDMQTMVFVPPAQPVEVDNQ